VIYAERRGVLEGDDLSEEILEWIDEVVEDVVIAHTESNFPEEWDIDGLFTGLHQVFPVSFDKDGLGPLAELDREELMTNLLRRGIATRRGVMASHLEKTYTDRIGKVSLPVTEEATEHTMLIPLFATMTDEEQTYVIDALREELGAA